MSFTGNDRFIDDGVQYLADGDSNDQKHFSVNGWNLCIDSTWSADDELWHITKVVFTDIEAEKVPWVLATLVEPIDEIMQALTEHGFAYDDDCNDDKVFTGHKDAYRNYNANAGV